jgi:hypothetical protein
MTSFDADGIEIEPEQIAHRAQQVERLLDELRECTEPPTWFRIEELSQALVALYGEGLARLVTLGREAAREPGAFDERLAFDELLSGLLSLHGLHPLDVRERIERALRAIENAVSDTGVHVELEKVENGTARLCVVGTDDVATTRSVSRLAIHAVESAAPELEEISLVGPPGEATALIPVDRLLSGGRA